MPSRLSAKEENAAGNGNGDNRGMGGRDGVERQMTTAGCVAPGKGHVHVHPAWVQDGGGAEADMGRCQPVALAGPPVVGGRQ
jgi:hypothetical protein